MCGKNFLNPLRPKGRNRPLTKRTRRMVVKIPLFGYAERTDKKEVPAMTLGQRIQELRKGLSLSQEELGEKMGVSRQAISKWEGDQTIPELDKLISLSKLFGLTVGQLLGVEQPVPAPAANPKTSHRMKLLLAGMGTAILVLALVVGALWSQVLSLNRRTVLEEEYVLIDREIFQTAECQLSEIELGFPQARGDQDLTLTFTAKPVKELKNWTVIGLTAYIEGRNPWGQHPDGTPISQEEREWHRTENIPVSQGTASLTLPDYGGESVQVLVSLREKGTGRTIGTADPVFTLTAETERAGDFFITGIQVEENTAPRAPIPKSIALALPDPRFEA